MDDGTSIAVVAAAGPTLNTADGITPYAAIAAATVPVLCRLRHQHISQENRVDCLAHITGRGDSAPFLFLS